MSKTLTIYTDGSCMPNPGKGGWAYIVLYDDVIICSSGFDPKSTNNIMEMTAVIEALADFSDYKKFIIHSDSMYVINCAKGLWKRKKNIQLWKKFDQVSAGKKIDWIWVKGHSGNEYNEMVDRMAKQEIR